MEEFVECLEGPGTKLEQANSLFKIQHAEVLQSLSRITTPEHYES